MSQQPDCENGDCRDHYGDPLAWCARCQERYASPPPTPDVERLTWQPIATCPVGERVLIGGGGCPRVHENELRDFRSAGRAFAGLGDAEQPTHWMPLPDRPVAGDTPTPGGEQPR